MEEQTWGYRVLKFLKGGINPDLTLLENWFFRLAVITPISLATYVLMSNGVLAGEDQIDGFYPALNYIWNNEKLIFLIAGLSFPLGAIAASHLRSLQSSTQIKQQKEQNIFINHFKHLEEFEKSLSKTSLEKYTIKISANEIHSTIFQNSTGGIYKINPKVKIQLRKCLLRIERFSLEAKSRGATKKSIKLLHEHLNEDIFPIIGKHTVNLPEVSINKYDYLITLLRRYTEIAADISECCSFYSRHKTSEISNICEGNKSLVEESIFHLYREEGLVQDHSRTQINMIKNAKINATINYELVAKHHGKILKKIESHGLSPTKHYPYEEIIDLYPTIRKDILDFIKETAPEEIIEDLNLKMHPQQEL